MAFSPDNRWVVTGSEDSTARLWDLKAADPAAQPVVLKGHEVRLGRWPSARTTAGWSLASDGQNRAAVGFESGRSRRPARRAQRP